MKKTVLIISVLAVIGAGAASYFLLRGSTLAKETTPVVVGAITAISDGWDVEELKAWTDPGLIKAMASQGQSAAQLMGIYSALGKLRNTPECHVRTTGAFMKNREQHTTVSHECMAEYENGPAQISITVSKAESAAEWQIYYIRINSEVFGGAMQ